MEILWPSFNLWDFSACHDCGMTWCSNPWCSYSSVWFPEGSHRYWPRWGIRQIWRWWRDNIWSCVWQTPPSPHDSEGSPAALRQSHPRLMNPTCPVLVPGRNTIRKIFSLAVQTKNRGYLLRILGRTVCWFLRLCVSGVQSWSHKKLRDMSKQESEFSP